MNFKFPSSLDNIPPNPNPNYNGNPNSSYFTQQAIRAGYATGDVNHREINGFTTTSDVRRREFEGFTSTNDVRRHEIEGFTSTNDVKRHEFEGFTSTSDVRRRQFQYPSNAVDVVGSNPIDVRGSMEREMAKERIRAEIIAEENMRKRLLEEEVRREMMRERELGFRHRDYGVGGSTGLIRMEPRRDPFSRNFEHRDRGGSVGGSGVWSHREVEFGGGFDTMPYNQDYRNNRVAQRSGNGVILREIKEVGRVVDPHDVSKDKAIVLAKSSANLAYLKRKTMTPPVGGATEVFKKQKTKEQWRCALCQVTATSERGLKDHFQGKKHQANEKGIVPHRTGFGTEPLPNTVNSSTVKPLTLVSIPSTSNVKNNGKRRGESSLAKVDIAPSRNATHPPLKLKKTGKVLGAGKRGKQKKGFQFFCQMCQIGANSMIVFDAHKKGKKHLANLSVTNKTDEAAQNSKDTLVKSKGTSSSKRGNREAKGSASGKSVKPKKKFQYFCEICQIGANSMTVFDAHKNGKKHLAKLSELNITDESVRVEASPKKALSSGENCDGDFKKEETSGGNCDGVDKEGIEETDGENCEGDVKEELEETGGESFDGEELDETGGEDFDDDANEELEETGEEDFDDDANEELEETGDDDDANEELEETGDDDDANEELEESGDSDGSRPEGMEMVVEAGDGETLAPNLTDQVTVYNEIDC